MTSIATDSRITKFEDLSKYDIPSSIAEMMRQWKVIVKSMYSDSFYSDTNIGWNHKPDKSFRVSDHWNFISSDSVIHCKTNIPVPSNTHVSIGRFNAKNDWYEILKVEKTKAYVEHLVYEKKKLEFFRDPKTIQYKTWLKTRILNKEIMCRCFVEDVIEYSGLLERYTGSSIKIVHPLTMETVYLNNYLSKQSHVLLYERTGEPIENLYDENIKRQRILNNQ